MRPSTQNFGLDAALLTRITTGMPPSFMIPIVAKLTELVREEGATIFASNLVIAECWLALRHGYGVPQETARKGLFRVLTSGIVHPMGGQDVLDELRSTEPTPLLDRLAIEEYAGAGLRTLTLSRRLGELDTVTHLDPDAIFEAHHRLRRRAHAKEDRQPQEGPAIPH